MDSSKEKSSKNSSEYKVNSIDDLWRFTTGWVKDGCVPGDEYMILKTYHGTYVQMEGNEGYLRNASGSIHDWEKFKVHWLGSGKVALETIKGCYCYVDPDLNASNDKRIFCDRPVSESIRDKDKWEVWVSSFEPWDQKQFHIRLKNVDTGYHMSARDWKENQQVWWWERGADDWEFFWGWKNGKEEDWAMTDEEVCVETLDNTDATNTNQMKYTQKVGMSKTESSTCSVSGGASVPFGKEFGEKFSAGINSSINFDWSQTSATTWEAEISRQVVVNVSPGYIGKLYQVFGYWGPYTIKTSEYIVREETRDGTVCKEYKVKGEANEK